MCFFACISMRPKVWLYSKEVRYADVLIIRRMLSTLGRSTGLVLKKKLATYRAMDRAGNILIAYIFK